MYNRLYHMTNIDNFEKKTIQTRVKDIIDSYIEDAPTQLSVAISLFIEEYLKEKAVKAIEEDIAEETKTPVHKGLIKRVSG